MLLARSCIEMMYAAGMVADNSRKFGVTLSTWFILTEHGASRVYPGFFSVSGQPCYRTDTDDNGD